MDFVRVKSCADFLLILGNTDVQSTYSTCASIEEIEKKEREIEIVVFQELLFNWDTVSKLFKLTF